jgi:hypothetical protein
MDHHHHNNHSLGSSLPHHRLQVYGKSLELLAAVRATQVRDAKLRDEALRAAKSVCVSISQTPLRPSLGLAMMCI